MEYEGFARDESDRGVRAMDDLFDQASVPRDFVCDGVSDIAYPVMRRARATTVMGFLAASGLSRRSRGLPTRESLPEFVTDARHDLVLLTEADIPQFLIVYWFLSRTQGRPLFDACCYQLIEAICRLNRPEMVGGLPDPYHEKAEVINKLIPGIDRLAEALLQAMERHHASTIAGPGEPANSDDHHIGPLPVRQPDWGEEAFPGFSYTLESLVLLYTRRNWKRSMSLLWPDITRITWCRYVVDKIWRFYWWDNDNSGELRMVQPKRTMSWTSLRSMAAEDRSERLPSLFREAPDLLLLFVLVAPHRFTSDAALFLDQWVRSLPHGQLSREAGTGAAH